MDIQRTELPDQELLTSQHAAEFLGGTARPISLSTLAYWRRTRQGPAFVRIGKSIRYRVSELRAFQQVTPAIS